MCTFYIIQTIYFNTFTLILNQWNKWIFERKYLESAKLQINLGNCQIRP